MKNVAADLLLGIAGDPDEMLENIGATGEFDLALLTLHPQGLRPYLSNWEQAAPVFIRRCQSEAIASGDPVVQDQFARYIELAGPLADSDPVSKSLLPILPLELNVNGLELSLFSVISTFGTPQDITTDELRIEAFYPTNTETEQFFTSLG